MLKAIYNFFSGGNRVTEKKNNTTNNRLPIYSKMQQENLDTMSLADTTFPRVAENKSLPIYIKMQQKNLDAMSIPLAHNLEIVAEDSRSEEITDISEYVAHSRRNSLLLESCSYSRRNSFTSEMPSHYLSPMSAVSVSNSQSTTPKHANPLNRTYSAPALSVNKLKPMVLVSEDLEVNAKLLVKFLKKLEFKVTLVKTGIEMIEKAMHTKYDWIVSDIDLPIKQENKIEMEEKLNTLFENNQFLKNYSSEVPLNINGINAAKIIRACSLLNVKTPITFQTANAENIIEFQESNFDASITHFTTKPVGIAKFKESILYFKQSGIELGVNTDDLFFINMSSRSSTPNTLYRSFPPTPTSNDEEVLVSRASSPTPDSIFKNEISSSSSSPHKF